MKTIEWDLTPSWWGNEWWLQHCASSFRAHERRDPQAVGYSLECILRWVTPTADIAITNTSLVARFVIEDEAMFLAQYLERRLDPSEPSILTEAEIRERAPKSLDELKRRVMRFIEDIAVPFDEGHGVRIRPSYGHLNFYAYFNGYQMELQGVPDCPDVNVMSAHQTMEPQHPRALRDMFERAVGWLTEHAIKDDPVSREVESFRARAYPWQQTDRVSLVEDTATCLREVLQSRDADKELLDDLVSRLYQVASADNLAEALEHALEAEDLEWELFVSCDATGALVLVIADLMGLDECDLERLHEERRGRTS